MSASNNVQQSFFFRLFISWFFSSFEELSVKDFDALLKALCKFLSFYTKAPRKLTEPFSRL